MSKIWADFLNYCAITLNAAQLSIFLSNNNLCSWNFLYRSRVWWRCIWCLSLVDMTHSSGWVEQNVKIHYNSYFKKLQTDWRGVWFRWCGLLRSKKYWVNSKLSDWVLSTQWAKNRQNSKFDPWNFSDSKFDFIFRFCVSRRISDLLFIFFCDKYWASYDPISKNSLYKVSDYYLSHISECYYPIRLKICRQLLGTIRHLNCYKCETLTSNAHWALLRNNSILLIWPYHYLHFSNSRFFFHNVVSHCNVHLQYSSYFGEINIEQDMSRFTKLFRNNTKRCSTLNMFVKKQSMFMKLLV